MRQHRIAIPQDRDTPLREDMGVFRTRYAYARAYETRKSDDRGQDYLAVSQLKNSIQFVVCDGVGLSYYGDIAARIIGGLLLDWIGTFQNAGVPGEDMQEQLERRLHDWTAAGTKAVNEQELPGHINGLFREVLEDKKNKGSESMFVCGRIDLPGEEYPEGRIILMWMGDIRIRLWSQGKEQTSLLGTSYRNKSRWSTVRGPVGGGPVVYTASLKSSIGWLDRLAIYSDGLREFDRMVQPLSNRDMQQFIERESHAVSSDDITFMEICWSPEMVLSNRSANAQADRERLELPTSSRRVKHTKQKTLYRTFVSLWKKKKRQR